MSSQRQPATDPLPTSPGEVHRRIVELHAAGRFEEGLLLIDPDVVDHRGGAVGDRHGRDAWRAKWATMADTAFADVSVKVENNVEAGDISVNRYTARGTHIASGRGYRILGIDMIRVRDGRLVEHWALMDSAALRHQLDLDGLADFAGPSTSDRSTSTTA
jgi:ketosteroid isomerase-like protein